MKAMKYLFILLAAGILMTGCIQDTYVQGTEMYMIDYDVRSNQWQPYGDCYRATLDVREITRDIVRDGNVQVSRCYPGDYNGMDVWTPLPAMRVESTVVDGADYYYTTYIDYEWTFETVNIFVTASDLYMDDVPEDMSFRVIITR